MRIGFVCSEYPPGPHGGIGTCTQVLGRALASAGHRVRVIGSYPQSHPAPETEVDRGVEVLRLRQGAHRIAWIGARWKLWREVSRWAKRREVDLVEVPDWMGPAAGWPALPVPVVVRVNGTARFFAAEAGGTVPGMISTLEGSSLRRADFRCASSRYAAERTQSIFGLPPGPFPVLHNPVEIPSQSGFRPRSGHRVVFTGTLAEKKGVISLVRAWPRVLAQVPEAELHFFGKDDSAPDGSSMSAYLLSLLDGNAPSTVRFHGHVPRAQLYQALENARVAAFPSYAETYGIAAFEAMATGCPTIYTRRGPGPELLRDGYEALLVEPDSPEEIARAILRIFADDELAGRLGEAGRLSVASRFSIGTLLAENESFYAECMRRFADG